MLCLLLIYGRLHGMCCMRRLLCCPASGPPPHSAPLTAAAPTRSAAQQRAHTYVYHMQAHMSIQSSRRAGTHVHTPWHTHTHTQDIRTRAPLHFRLTNLHASSLYESVGAASSCCAHRLSCAHPCVSPLYLSLSFLPGTHLWACSRSSAGCTLGSHKLADHTTTATVQRHHKHASMRALGCRSIPWLFSPLLFCFPPSLSLSALHSSLALRAVAAPVCVCQPPPHVADPSSRSSLHFWHCHSPG